MFNILENVLTLVANSSKILA